MADDVEDEFDDEAEDEAEVEVDKAHPRRTADLIGQAEAEAALLASWQSGRLPHGWLIGGPKGIGKATLAYRFARFLLAEGGGEGAGGLFGDAPERLALPIEHPVFRQVAAGAHPGLIAVERQLSERSKVLSTVIRVDQVRELARFFTLTAAAGGWRIAIVDGADEMNESAANAILKVLEEPPRRALLLLLAHAPNRLLPTIRSRCRKLTLKPLGDTEMTAFLDARLPDLTPADRQALTRLAEGRPGRALALAEEGGIALYRDLVALLQTLPRLEPERLHALAERHARRDQASVTAHRVWMELLGLWLNRLVLAGAGRAPEAAVDGEAELGRRLVDGRGLDRWLELWEKVCRLARQGDGLNLDRKHVVLSALLAVEAAARG
jgi:DNA polymerase-3 subunit delta'